MLKRIEKETEGPDVRSLNEKAKELVGVVYVNENHERDKTIKVEIEKKIKHKLYGKYIERRKKIMVHDEKNECNNGDKVIIRECRPISKRKRWIFYKKISSGTV